MANTISFFDFDESLVHLSKTEVQDLIDALFRDDAHFRIYGKMRKDRKSKPTLGLHVYDAITDSHEIYLSPEKIEACFNMKTRAGGNIVAPHLKIAMGMVVAHEVQHANQHLVHGDEKSFFGKKRSRYRSRPCEREARNIADESIHIIAGIVGVELLHEKFEKIPDDEVESVAECFLDWDDVSTQDIVEELRNSGINNAVNVMKVKKFLSDWKEQT